MRIPFLTGSYARPDEEGVCLIELDTEQNRLIKVDGWRGFNNPSYLIHDGTKEHLFIVEELTPEGNVLSAGFAGRQLTVRQRLSSHGADPCHLCLWPDGKTLVVCNYTDGSFATYQVDRDGLLTTVQTEKLIGGSVHPQRQERAHMHFSAFRGGKAWLVDLGSDSLYVSPAEEDSGRIRQERQTIQLPPGTGPRHFAFGEEGFLYIVSELHNEICVLRPSGDGYTLIQRVNTVPEGTGGLAAAIRIQDQRLFVSNRGEDSIAMYQIREDGTIQWLDSCPTGGRVPRDFEVVGRHIIVCNQESSLLTVLEIDSERESLRQTELSLPLPRPTCVCLL